MKTKIENHILTLTLGPECTIAEVERDTDKLRFFPEGIKMIEIEAGAVREMDTAYLQALLSLKVTAGHRGIDLRFSGISAPVQEICELYGESLQPGPPREGEEIPAESP
jgi:anti-anti-sigma regulatory factor